MLPKQRHYRNDQTPGALVFATATVLDFVPIFKNERHAAACVSVLGQTCRERGGRLYARVVMPEHMHLLVALPLSESASVFLGRLKSLIAREIAPNLSLEEQYRFSEQIGLNRRTLWQRSFRSFPVESERLYEQKVDYIHENPVRRGLCARPEDYPWSSARMHVAGRFRGEEEGLSLKSSDMLPSGCQMKSPPQGAET